MKRPDLEAIRQRCYAATLGPWEDCPTFEAHGEIVPACIIVGDDDEEICEARLSGPNAWNDANMAFAAHARQDIPELLAYIAELEAERRDKP